MSLDVFKLYGEAFRLRFTVDSLLFFLHTAAFSDAYIIQLQLKYGSSGSEDHQFVRGIPIYTISQVLEKILSGVNGPPLLINGFRRPMPLLRILEVELYPTLLSKARSFGLSDDWILVCLLHCTIFFFFSFPCNLVQLHIVFCLSSEMHSILG